MFKYRVKAVIRKQYSDSSSDKIVEATDRHPDMAKVRIERENPGYTIHQILEIADLTPTKKRWDEK